MKGLRYLSALLLIALLPACTSSPSMDLTLKMKAGDASHYQIKETIDVNVAGEPSVLNPMGGTLDVIIHVDSTEGNQANADCVVILQGRNEWPIPVTLNMQTGGTTIRDNTLNLKPEQLDLFFDRYMLALGARPGRTQTAVGARWKGEMRQLPIGGVLSDPVRLPLTLELTEVAESDGRRLATVQMWGEQKLDIEHNGKQPGRATGTLSATGTMVIDLDTSLVERSDTKVITKLNQSWDGRETEGINTIELKRVKSFVLKK